MAATPHAEGLPARLMASGRSASESSPLVPQRPRMLRVESAERSDNGSNGGSHALLQQPASRLRQSSSAEDEPSPLDHARAIRPRLTPTSHAALAAQVQGSPSVVAAVRDASQDGMDRMPVLSVGPPALLTPRKDPPSFSMRPPAPRQTTPPQQQSGRSCCAHADCSKLFCCFRDSQKMCSSHWAGKRLQLSVALQLVLTVVLPLAGVLVLLGLLMTRQMHETHEARQTQQNLQMMQAMQGYLQQNGREMGWATLYGLQLATAAAAAAAAASQSAFDPTSLEAHTMLARCGLNTDWSLMHLSSVVEDQAGDSWTAAASGATVDPGRLALYSSADLLATVSFAQSFEWARWQQVARDGLLATPRADLANFTWGWPDSLQSVLNAALDHDEETEDAIAMLLRAASDASSDDPSSAAVEDLSAMAQYSPRLNASSLRFTRSYLTLHSSLLRTLRALLSDTVRRTQRTGDAVGVESSAALAGFAALVDTQELMLVQAATNLALMDALNATAATTATATDAIENLVRASAEADLRVQMQMQTLLGALSHEDALALASRQLSLDPPSLDALARSSSLQRSINAAVSSSNVTATLLALGFGSNATAVAGVLADSSVAPSLLSDFGRAALLGPLDARTASRFDRAAAATIGLLFLIVFLAVSACVAGAYQVRTVWMLQRREHDRTVAEGGAAAAGDKEQLMRQGTMVPLGLARQTSFLGNPKPPPPSPGLFTSGGRGSGSNGGGGSFVRTRAESFGGFGGLSGANATVANSNANGLGLFGSPSLGPRRATMDASSPGAPQAAGVIGGEFVAPPTQQQQQQQPLPSPPSGASSSLSVPLDSEGGNLILMAGSPLRRNGDRHLIPQSGPSPHRTYVGKDRAHGQQHAHHRTHRSAQVSQFLQAEFENVMGPALLPRSATNTSNAQQHQQQQHAHQQSGPRTPPPINLAGLRSLEIPLLNFDALLPPDNGSQAADDAQSMATPSSNWTVTHTGQQPSDTGTSRGVDDPLATGREMSTLHEENDVQALSTFASACPTPYDESARSRMGSPTDAARANRRIIIANANASHTLSFGVPSPPKDASPATAAPASGSAASSSAAPSYRPRLFVPVRSGGNSGGPASASRSASSDGDGADLHDRSFERDPNHNPLVGHGVLFLSSQAQAHAHNLALGRNLSNSAVLSQGANPHYEHSSSSMSVPPAEESPSPAFGAPAPLPSAVRFAPSTMVHSPPAANAGPSQVLRQLRVSDPLAALAAYSASTSGSATAVMVHAVETPVLAAPQTPPLPPLFLSIAPLASAGLVIASSPALDPMQGLSLTPRLDPPPPESSSPSLQLDRPSTTQGGGGGGGTRTTTREGGVGGDRSSGSHNTAAMMGAPTATPSSLPVVLRSATRSDGQ